MSTPDLSGLDDVERMLHVVTLLQNELEEKNRELERVNAELERANEELKRMALTDPLTHLFNRRYFMEQAEKEILRHNRAGLPLSMLILDIDRFKRINDTRGHVQGDAVIIGAANLMLDALRRPDILARYGGEEFIALLPETDARGARLVAEKVRERIAGHRFPGMNDEPVTASIGVGTLAVSGAAPLMAFVERIDKALYAAKTTGRNRVESAEP